MIVIQSYSVAVMMCIVTMLCWGSWANTQKLATKQWKFQLFYWDYSIGVLLLSLVAAFTLGSVGESGRGFVADISQAGTKYLMLAIIGGVIFNLANILLVAAIDIAGMAVAFPIGIGMALVIGVVVNYIAAPLGSALMIFSGVGCIAVAIILDAIAYKRMGGGKTSHITKGVVLSVLCGVTMGAFYRFVAASMSTDFVELEAGKLSPYSAVVFFSLGLFLSNFIFNTIVMIKPFSGEAVKPMDYFKKGNTRLHLIGILGGAIWCLGMALSIIASGQAGFAISYGLGQGATMVAAFWGVFIWKEFKSAPAGTNKLLAFMFALYLIGLTLIIAAKFV
ncbi:MAG: multidrug DMT transporter permease [Deltaproteobacteria bacterium]|nr:MAG: multidrug DMT transporter permease [Deltaproteobacteria bacterium]